MKLLLGMRPQDVVVLLKVVAMKNRPWRHVDLSYELSMSQSEVSSALQRCKKAGLVDEKKRTVFKSALLEFLVHGLKYVYPAEPGAIGRGVPTAHSAPPLVSKILSSESEVYVWPSPKGETRGQIIAPLFPTVPQAAMKDFELYQLLSLVDAIRVGRVREQRLAVEALKKRIKGS